MEWIFLRRKIKCAIDIYHHYAPWAWFDLFWGSFNTVSIEYILYKCVYIIFWVLFLGLGGESPGELPIHIWFHELQYTLVLIWQKFIMTEVYRWLLRSLSHMVNISTMSCSFGHLGMEPPAITPLIRIASFLYLARSWALPCASTRICFRKWDLHCRINPKANRAEAWANACKRRPTVQQVCTCVETQCAVNVLCIGVIAVSVLHHAVFIGGFLLLYC